VLAFPSEDPAMAGDVVLAYETIAREAEECGQSMLRHAIRMLIHGVVHLRGYDHLEDIEAEEMEQKEQDIIAKTDKTIKD
jgi:probable rRNA maturation factor